MSEFSLYNIFLTVNVTSGAARCCWWLCSLVDGKLQKFHW